MLAASRPIVAVEVRTERNAMADTMSERTTITFCMLDRLTVEDCEGSEIGTLSLEEGGGMVFGMDFGEG